MRGRVVNIPKVIAAYPGPVDVPVPFGGFIDSSCLPPAPCSGVSFTCITRLSQQS